MHEKFTEVVSNNHLLLNSGVPKPVSGVGFLLNAKYVDSITEFNSFSKRICLLKLKSKHNNITFIQVHAPDTIYPDYDEVKNFYDSVQELVNIIPNQYELVVMGHFNPKVGGVDQKDIIGKHSNTSRGYNKRGERLEPFCKENSLMITNTLFQHRRKWTWYSPGERIRNTIDYIFFNFF